jgi:hypothetical protein
MHTFINSRSMVQMVALDLMAEEARRSEVRRGRRERRSTRAASSRAVGAGTVETHRPRWWMARALRLVH